MKRREFLGAAAAGAAGLGRLRGAGTRSKAASPASTSTRGHALRDGALACRRAPASDAAHARRHRRRRRRRPRGGARVAAGRHRGLRAARTRRRGRRQQPRRPGRRHRLPARRALPAGAGRRGARSAGPARRAGPAPARGGPLGIRRAPPLPQPAGAPVLPGRMAGRPAARAGRGRGHAGAVPPVLAARGGVAAREARFSIPTLRAQPAPLLLALDARALRRLARPRGLHRPAAALVPRLLLPRRLRRRHGPGLGLGRHPLLRQPPRLPCAGRRRRRARRGADLARGQRLAHAPAGRRRSAIA